ncbi:MAG TPA: RNA polymerase sigma factor [Polyangiaceae bacterium]|nr:RNA polymerase sigma factor [Polyangiaceae bacterium]
MIEKGDYRAALERLMVAYGDRVFRFCRRFVKDDNVAADLLQKTFVRAYQGLPTFARGSSLYTWLLGIAKNQALDVLRAAKRDASRLVSDDELLAEAVEAEPEAGERLDRKRAKDALLECIASCASAAEKDVLLLHFHEELSYEEMGALLGEKADTLRARVTRAFPKLRRCLERKGVTS